MHSVPRSTPKHIAWLLPAGTLFFMCGILLGRIISSMLPALIALGLSLCAALLSRGWRRTFALLLAALSLGTGLGWRAYHPALPAEGTYTLCATVADEVIVEDAHVQTVLTDVTLDGTTADDGYWTFYLKEGETLPEWLVPGAQITFTAKVYQPSGQTNPNGFNFREYLLQRGIRIGIYGADGLTQADAAFSLQGSLAALRHQLTERLTAVMGDEGGAYAAAMLLGTKDFIAEDDLSAFRNLGIAHILTVSGYHVGVLSAWLLLLLRPLPISRKARALWEALLLGLYCLLTGGNAPVVRAVTLLLLRELTRVCRRQILPLHLLCSAALLQLCVNPTLLTSASFQLTYSAMLGLLLVYPRIKTRVLCRSQWGKRLWEAFAASLSAQLGLLLPLLYWFGELPLLSLVLNMAVIPLAGLLMSQYWLTLALLPIPLLRDVAGTLSAWGTAAFLSAVRFLAGLELGAVWTRQPGWLTCIGWVLLLFSLSTLVPSRLNRFRRWGAGLGAALMVLILIPLPQSACTYTQFDVGDADAAVLRDGEVTAVIDLGEDGEAVIGYLRDHGLSIDVLILTHLHTDHAGGLRALIDADIPVAVCCVPAGADVAQADSNLLPLLDELSVSGTAIQSLSRGDVIVLPRCTLSVLWPVADRVTAAYDANDGCLVMQADIRGVTLLLTGDITGEYEDHVAVPSDILKVAHHGSSASTSEDFLTAVDPQLLLLSNKMASRQLRMEELAGETPLYSTAEDGAVTLSFPGNGVFRIVSPTRTDE